MNKYYDTKKKENEESILTDLSLIIKTSHCCLALPRYTALHRGCGIRDFSARTMTRVASKPGIFIMHGPGRDVKLPCKTALKPFHFWQGVYLTAREISAAAAAAPTCVIGPLRSSKYLYYSRRRIECR